MNCPDCSAPMTHHASKVIDPRSEREEALRDPDLGGTVLERHTCPACGRSATRLADPGRESER